MDDSLKRPVGWMTAIRIAVLLLILLSALLVQAGSGVALEISFLWAVNAAPGLTVKMEMPVSTVTSPALSRSLAG